MSKTTVPTMDVAALRAFQSTWGPVIDAIPAVINMAEQFADIERGIVSKQKELAAVIAKVESAMDEGNAKYADLQKKIGEAEVALAAARDNLQARQGELAAELRAEQEQATSNIAKVKAETEATIRAIKEQVVGEADKLQQVRKEQAAELAAAEERLAEVEKRVKSAESSLAALRAKLG